MGPPDIHTDMLVKNTNISRNWKLSSQSCETAQFHKCVKAKPQEGRYVKKVYKIMPPQALHCRNIFHKNTPRLLTNFVRLEQILIPDTNPEFLLQRASLEESPLWKRCVRPCENSKIIEINQHFFPGK